MTVTDPPRRSDLDELLSSPGLSLTDRELDTIVAHIRSMRSTPYRATGPKAKAPEPAVIPPALQALIDEVNPAPPLAKPTLRRRI